ncbi:TetR/AcrR family transcriptional regulator [Croceicoccus sp. YJ47]|uniref:TetR/AcrR family transcriptional regulator n=1 Tax=Croceicoccus sp. YJ47 TaxID=2798724 RepID=UPI0019243689|nr:TetR/AcrR family transcriptional regulator [Croceicoccus sp. YJ47]QQN75373.1 TetR/AcrR family transcriptional regulator [Croceicoccus sp. YJ47]
MMSTAETERFGRKRQDVIHAASTLINDVGVKGMTFSDVAQAVGLNATSITYYFGRKERLVTAVYEATLDFLEQMATEALAQPDPRARVRHFLHAHIALRRRIREGERGLVTVLAEICTLEDEAQKPLLDHYRRVRNTVRDFFGPTTDLDAKLLNTARAHTLLEAVFWWPVWSTRYSIRDFERVEDRWFDILEHGLAGRGSEWAPHPLGTEWRSAAKEDPQTLDEFLRAATTLINQRGYRGASVNRIAQSLNVTKGSFYHHHNAKDDLVSSCFTRSYDRMSAVQIAGIGSDGDYWTRLCNTLAELIDVQFFDDMPLLRTTALQSLPEAEREDVVLRSNRLARRFAGMLIDGIADGSVRAIDPLIASQLIMSTLNSAYEARVWAARFDEPAKAVKYYAWSLCAGVFADPPTG